MVYKLNRLSDLLSYGFRYLEDLHCYTIRKKLLSVRYTSSDRLVFLLDGEECNFLVIERVLYGSFSITADSLYIYEHVY